MNAEIALIPQSMERLNSVIILGGTKVLYSMMSYFSNEINVFGDINYRLCNTDSHVSFDGLNMALHIDKSSVDYAALCDEWNRISKDNIENFIRNLNHILKKDGEFRTYIRLTSFFRLKTYNSIKVFERYFKIKTEGISFVNKMPVIIIHGVKRAKS